MHPQAVAELQFCDARGCGRWEAECVELAWVGEALQGGGLAVAAAGQGPKPALEVSWSCNVAEQGDNRLQDGGADLCQNVSGGLQSPSTCGHDWPEAFFTNLGDSGLGQRSSRQSRIRSLGVSAGSPTQGS